MKTQKILSAILVILLACLNKATGATYTWVGASGASWTSSASWTGGTSGGYPGSSGSSDVAIFAVSGVTVAYTGTRTISNIQTPYGVSGVTLQLAAGSVLNVTSGLTIGQPSGAAVVLNIAGSGGSAGIINIGGTTTMGYRATLGIASPAKVYFTAGATLDMTGSQGAVTNAGTLVFLAGCTCKFGDFANLINSGSLTTYQTTFTLNGSGSPNNYINNSGSIRDHGSSFNVTGQGAYIANSGSSSSFYGSGTTISFTGGSNGMYLSNAHTFTLDSASVVNLNTQACNLTNSGTATFTLTGSTINTTNANTGNFAYISNPGGCTFTANGGSVINMSSYQGYITNAGTFFAGTSGSACSINLAYGGNTLGPNTSVYNTGVFIVGSMSVINATSTDASHPNIVYNNGGTFTLQSDALGSASIGQLGSASSFQGTFNVQRYLTGNNSLAYRGYRLLSSPVNVTSYLSSTTGSNYISLQNLSTPYTVNGVTYYGASTGGPGGSTNGFTIKNNNPTIFFYNEPTLVSGNSSFLAGKNVGVASIGNPILSLTSTQYGTHSVNMPVGNGFIMFYIGNTNNNPTGAMVATSNSTVTFPGYINQQDVPVFLWYTPNAGSVAGTAGKLSVTTGAAGSGYNMLGNPYPNIIDLNKVYSDNSDTSKYTTFYELTAPGQNYVSYNASSGAKSSMTYSSRYIASGQGFVVQARKPGLSLTFKEDQKVPYSATPVLSGTTTPPILLSLRNGASATTGSAKSAALMEPTNTLDGLHLKMSIDSATYTECGIYFSKQWSDGYDSNDAIDLGGISPKMTLSSLCKEGLKLGINSLSDYTRGKRIKLYIAAAASGNYSLGLADIQNIDTALFHLYLVDNLKKDSTDLISSKSYGFTVTNGDTTTYGANRFVLAVERKALPAYQLLSFTAQKVSNGVLLTWKTANESKFTGFSVQKQDGTQYATLYSVQSDGSGVYTYTDIKPASGTNIYRLGQNDIDSLETYSNPVSVVYNTTAPSSSLVSVYPNPAKEQITISFSGATNSTASYTASIYNSTGLLVGQKSVSGESWSQDISALRPGGYVLEIRSGNGSLIGNTKFTKYQ